MSLRWRVAQRLEHRWWKNYLRHKDPQDYQLWKKKYWRDFLDDLSLDPPQNERILDIGCGPAGIFTILEENSVTAVDPLLEKYRQLDHFDESWYPWVTFERSTLENYSAEPFGLIFCINAINHVRGLSAGFDSLFDLLDPSGRLIISTDCHRYSFFKKLFRITQGDILHPHQFSEAEYAQMIEERGGIIVNRISPKRNFFFDYVVFDVLKTDQ